jgi:glycosyltransferase involved in cell wall biosynthesis
MKILVAHNKYRQPGGEDIAFENEVNLLASSGYDVRTLVVSNDSIESYVDRVLTTLRTVENPRGVALMSRAVENFRPDIVHIHNFFPLFSPAVYEACRRRGSAVVQTLHNYRPICANGQLLRSGKTCNLCIQGSPIWGAVHRCYRDSLTGSAAVARMISIHRRRGTWLKYVSQFLVLTQFARNTFTQAGFPADRIYVKPNFIDDPGDPEEAERKSALFVGRLSQEKGVRLLIEASARYNFPIRIAGDGPELKALQNISHSNVCFLGRLPRESILKEMRHAAVVVVPSLWYEGFPMVILEAFASETPVIASRLGALAEIVEHGVNGFHVPPGNSDELGQCVAALLGNSVLARGLGRSARRTYLERYTPQANIAAIKCAYSKAVEHSGTKFSDLGN